jgi:hypothetical protein
MLVLGHVPTKAEILLRKGCDFTWFIEVEDDEPLPDDTTVTLYVYSRDSVELVAFWPAISVVPGGAQLQIVADDHEIIPDGGKFTVVLQKPGYPKTAWLEGRVSKVNR